ncbi:MAG: Rrf2 family transcriptional regulator [Deferribacteres bacterium]|nr:Rrf2 family transcriptional regulator [candidate division KSB1 bacterium]MCB9511978.1 Rrf2 family transcriptional regulator [Deferribacteres bacterium]
MKISAQEEYGLRILMQIGQHEGADGISIPEISRLEGLSNHNVAKLCRILRLAGLIKSSRGNVGGYSLAKPADRIMLSEVLSALGGRLYDEEFCENHAGALNFCSNSMDCSVRSLWQIIQVSIDKVLENISLKSLLEPAPTLYHITPNKPGNRMKLAK